MAKIKLVNMFPTVGSMFYYFDTVNEKEVRVRKCIQVETWRVTRASDSEDAPMAQKHDDSILLIDFKRADGTKGRAFYKDEAKASRLEKGELSLNKLRVIDALKKETERDINEVQTAITTAQKELDLLRRSYDEYTEEEKKLENEQ